MCPKVLALSLASGRHSTVWVAHFFLTPRWLCGLLTQHCFSWNPIAVDQVVSFFGFRCTYWTGLDISKFAQVFGVGLSSSLTHQLLLSVYYVPGISQHTWTQNCMKACVLSHPSPLPFSRLIPSFTGWNLGVFLGSILQVLLMESASNSRLLVAGYNWFLDFWWHWQW